MSTHCNSQNCSYPSLANDNHNLTLDARWNSISQQMEFDSGTAFSISVTQMWDQPPLILFTRMFGVPYTTNGVSNFALADMIASECGLQFCAQTFAEQSSTSNDSARDGPQQPTVEPQILSSEIQDTAFVSTFTLDHEPAEKLSFDNDTIWKIGSWMMFQLNGTHRIVQPEPGFGKTWQSVDEGGDFIKNIWKSAMDPDVFISNLAGSVTNYLRTVNASHDDSLNGVAYEFGVTVRWGWIVLPAALTLLSVVLLTAAIVKTHRSDIAPWKCSLLRLALFEVQEPVQEACEGRMDVYNGAEDAVGDWKARLRLQGGRWKFVGV